MALKLSGKYNNWLLRAYTRWFWHGRKEEAKQDRVLVPVAWMAPVWAARMIPELRDMLGGETDYLSGSYLCPWHNPIVS